eukprot:2764381-Heterocapsa_arctica.AAC.1
MIADVRAEVGAAANKPDIIATNPLRSRFYFVQCLRKRREVASEEIKTLSAEADVKTAKEAAAASSAMSDGAGPSQAYI